MADERTFVFDNRLAGYGATPTPERLSYDGRERRVAQTEATFKRRAVPDKLHAQAARGTDKWGTGAGNDPYRRMANMLNCR